MQAVRRLQPEPWLEEREGVLVAGAEDDGVDVGHAAVFEVAPLAVRVYVGEKGNGLKVGGPVEPHGGGPVRARDAGNNAKRTA